MENEIGARLVWVALIQKEWGQKSKVTFHSGCKWKATICSGSSSRIKSFTLQTNDFPASSAQSRTFHHPVVEVGFVLCVKLCRQSRYKYDKFKTWHLFQAIKLSCSTPTWPSPHSFLQHGSSIQVGNSQYAFPCFAFTQSALTAVAPPPPPPPPLFGCRDWEIHHLWLLTNQSWLSCNSKMMQLPWLPGNDCPHHYRCCTALEQLPGVTLVCRLPL